MQNNIFSGLFVGQNFVTLKEVDSTNSYLKDLLANSKPLMEGTVIMAENQYAGRGQLNSSWNSDPGKNLTFSLLLNPHFLPVVQQFDLTRAVSLGVFNALLPLLGEQLKIKWPNDIYYAGKKLGGMLIENILQGSRIKNSIVGIGINVNQEHFDASLAGATSVKQILHADYDLKTLLSEICRHIEACYLNLKAGRYLFVRNAYLSRLYGLNKKRNFKTGDRVISGVIRDVSDSGLLIISSDDGGEHRFNLKEIEFLNT